MDKLPPEILLKIFMNLTVDDIHSVSDTCIHWKNVIDYFNIWKINWLQLLHITSKLRLDDNIDIDLQKIDINDLDLSCSCVRLKNIIYNNYNNLHKCLISGNAIKFDYAILKTHYSQVTLAGFENKYSFPSYYHVKTNNTSPNCKSYMNFRSPPNLIKNVSRLFLNSKIDSEHIHVKELLYAYPMGVSEHIDPQVLQQLFEGQHVQEVVLVPRVLLLCDNLDISDAVVVYSTSRSTEFAVVLGGRVIRWVERFVGGWQIARSLHATFTWLNPGLVSGDIKRFDIPAVKSLCWLRMKVPEPINDSFKGLAENRNTNNSNNTNINIDGYELKSEQYLASELMYTELDLCGVLQQLLHDLPESQQKNCLSHVLLAGGNSQLKYLNQRVRLDLMRLWPQYAYIISTSVHNGSVLSYSPSVNLLYLEEFPVSDRFQSGCICRITRYNYIRGRTN